MTTQILKINYHHRVHQDRSRCHDGFNQRDKEVEPLARRRFLVRDIAEILEHWRAGRNICAISRSLGVSRATVRKYICAAESRGYRRGNPVPRQGWKAFIADVIPRPPDPSTRSTVFAALLP